MKGRGQGFIRIHHNCVYEAAVPSPLNSTPPPSHPPTFPPSPPVIQDSYVRAKAWIKELQRQASSNIVIGLAGNKADLARDNRLVEFEVS